jgi:hypothetical protein
VAKRKSDPYLPEHATWQTIRNHNYRNHNYSQWVGREELFERECGGNLDLRIWDSCVVACDEGRELSRSVICCSSS